MSAWLASASSHAHRYDPTIENVHHKTIRFRKVHFATDIVDTAGMVGAGVHKLASAGMVGAKDYPQPGSRHEC